VIIEQILQQFALHIDLGDGGLDAGGVAAGFADELTVGINGETAGDGLGFDEVEAVAVEDEVVDLGVHAAAFEAEVVEDAVVVGGFVEGAFEVVRHLFFGGVAGEEDFGIGGGAGRKVEDDHDRIVIPRVNGVVAACGLASFSAESQAAGGREGGILSVWRL